MADAEDVAGTRVSTLELFFDLVFVFTITQVAQIIEHHAAWHTTAQAALELLVIYWLYSGFGWLTNNVGSSTTRARIVLIGGMAAFLVVALAVPRAFGTDGKAFGIAYLVLTIVHAGGFLMLAEGATVGAMLRIGGGNLVAAGLLLGAGFVHGDAHWPLWVGAVVAQWLPALATLRRTGFDVDVAHFAERHELMIIIVLGESLVSVALAAQDVTVGASLVFGVLSGLAASAAMWWCYFDGDTDGAAESLALTGGVRRGLAALIGYDVTHPVMMAGVVGVAAGTRLSLHDLTGPTGTAAAWLIAAGIATYLAGLAMFRAVLGYASPWGRVLAAAAVLACAPIGSHAGAAQELAAGAAVVVVLLVAERVHARMAAAG